MSYKPDQRTVLTKPLKFYTAYAPKLIIALEFPADSEYTDQSFGPECDINTIMARYQSTGELPVLNEMEGQYLDVSEMDFQQHMDFILQAQDMFDQIPSKIRDRFGNDPGAFLGFCSDPDNHVELAKMGLLNEAATEALLYPPAPEPEKKTTKSKTDE